MRVWVTDNNYPTYVLNSLNLAFEPASDDHKKSDQAPQPFGSAPTMGKPQLPVGTTKWFWDSEPMDVDDKAGAWELTATAIITANHDNDGGNTGPITFKKDPEMIVKPGGGG